MTDGLPVQAPDENDSASLVASLPGGAALIDWFGYLPRFHDAEVLELSLNRVSASCRMKVHAFRMTSETDAEGYFVTDRHAIVEFAFSGVEQLELDGFNHQNALMELTVHKVEETGFIRVELYPAYGLGGLIEARELAFEIQPGMPGEGVYAERAELAG